jgi:CRP-like cAMP-binding protein
LAGIDVATRLGRSLVFGVFPPAKLARLAGAGTIVDLERGALLCQRGDPGDGAYLILEGELEVRTLSSGGKAVRLAALGVGEIAGEMAALDGAPRSADMIAARRTKLLRIGRTALLEALQDEPRAAIALIEALTGRLRTLDAAMESQRLLDLGGRLAKLLIAEVGSSGLVSLTQTEIARRLGASREKVNRKLHAWAADNWVAVTRAGVKVIRLDRLEELLHAQDAR